MHSQLQPFSWLDVQNLGGKHIDVLCCVKMDDNTKDLKWWHGKVLDVTAENKIQVE